MQKKMAVAVFLVLVAGGIRPPVYGQSLADVARQEEARRKALREPSKILTNRDLIPAPDASAKPPQTPETAKPGVAKETPKDSSKDAVKDQAYWGGRQKSLQAQLDQDQAFSSALQSQINGLSADFAARDDPAQRAVIERDRQKALAELTRLKDAIVKDQKAIADLAEEARRAAVPPGWLR